MRRPSILAAAALAVLALPAQAVTFRALDLTIANGDFAGNSVTGSLSFDETLLDLAGDGTFDPLGGFLSLDFSFEGQTFGLADDIDFPDLPELAVEGFLVTGLDFVVDETHPTNPVPIAASGVFNFSTFPISDDGTTLTGDVFVNTTLALVPLPAGLPLLAGALGWAALAGRRKRRAA